VKKSEKSIDSVKYIKAVDENNITWIINKEEHSPLYDRLKIEYDAASDKENFIGIVSVKDIFSVSDKKFSWDWKEAVERIKSTINFPLVEEPKLTIDEFPPDITLVSSNDLGSLMGKLEAWRSFISSQSMILSVELNILKSSFELGLGKWLFKLEEMSPKKRLKEGLISFIVTSNEPLRKAKITIMELEARTMVLNKAYELYSNQIATLSREITRRSIESKYEGRM